MCIAILKGFPFIMGVMASTKNKQIQRKVSLVAPYYTIFDSQVAYPDDVTLLEFADGILESVASVSTTLPDSIRSRFLKASTVVNSDSPFVLFSLAGAVHFSQVAQYQTPEIKDWILYNIVLELLDAVIRVPRIPLERRMNTLYRDFSEEMRMIFGNTRIGIMSFEAVIVFVQLDTVSVTDRRSAMLSFMRFLVSSKEIVKDRSLGAFDKAQRILILRESIMTMLDTVKKILINPPLAAAEPISASATKKRWAFLEWYRIL